MRVKILKPNASGHFVTPLSDLRFIAICVRLINIHHQQFRQCVQIFVCWLKLSRRFFTVAL